MSATRVFQNGRSLRVLASLALAIGLSIVSLMLVAGMAHAQTGSISGTITYYGGAPAGTYDLNVDVLTDLHQPPVDGTSLPSPGAYTISGLADDTYYVCASVDPHAGYPNPYTCYDADDDGEPDPVVVTGGGAVSGIDIALGGPWLPLGGPMVPGQVLGLAVHPAISGTVYAAVAPISTYDSGPSVIYKTTDGASSWTPVYTAAHQVYAMAATGTNVYAGAFNPSGEGPSIYASRDSGVSWTPVFSFTGRGVWLDVAVHPTDADVAIIGGWAYDSGGTYQSGLVHRTDDGGLTWSPILTVTFPGSEGTVNAVLIHPVTPTLILAAAHADNSSDGVLYRSEDGGTTWPISSTLSNAQFMSLVAHASDPQMLYAGTAWGEFSQGPNRVFRSADTGLSWTEVLSESGGLLAFEPPSTVYAVTNSGRVWSSTSDGDPGTWNSVNDVQSGLSFDIDLGPAPAALYVGSEKRGVFKSTDGGAQWEERNNGIESPDFPRDIDVDPQNPDRLFVAAECGKGWMTIDGGQTWTVPLGMSGCMGAFAINPENPNIAYGGGYDDRSGAVMRSEDGGLTFERVYTATFIMPDGSGGGESIYALAIALSAPSTVYAAGSDHPNGEEDQAVIVRSLDDGASWTQVFTLPARSQVVALTIDPADEDVVYASGEDRSGVTSPAPVGFVYRTTDGGDHWTPVLTATNNTVSSIVVDHQKPDVLYAADTGYRVYKSTDGGDNWAIVRRPPWEGGGPSGKLLAMDPHVPSRVYLGGWGYIAETTDGGQTWSEWQDLINQGTPGTEPQALTVDNSTPTQTLYAGFSSVWAYSRPAPQPGGPVTVTAQASAPSAQAGTTVTISCLVVDQHENWVADGTVVTFTTSPVGSFASSSVTKTTADGRTSATLTGVTSGTATVTVTAGIGMDTLTVDFTPFKIYLPIVLRNS